MECTNMVNYRISIKKGKKRTIVLHFSYKQALYYSTINKISGIMEYISPNLLFLFNKIPKKKNLISL